MKVKTTMRILLIGFLAIFVGTSMSACSGKIKKSTESEKSPSPIVPKAPMVKLAGAETITSGGFNFDGAYSADGSRIAYVGEGRSPNGSTQIFEINTKTKRDRQITFQDGLASSPRYVTGTSDLIYCSNTDEMKEKFELHHIMQNLGGGKAGAPSQSPNRMELYLHEGSGSRVLRLTTNPGYDCEVAIDPKHRRIVYVTETDGKFHFARLDLQPMRREILKDATIPILHSPTFSSDGKNLAWVQGETETNLQIVFGTADGHLLKTLTTLNAIHAHPTFSPDGNWIVLSSNRATSESVKKQFALYALSLQKPCIVRITHYDSGDDSYPYFSPDGNHVLFTHSTEKDVENGTVAQSHLFTMPFSAPTACDPEAP